MGKLSEKDVDAIARRIVADLRQPGPTVTRGQGTGQAAVAPPHGEPGIFATVDEAVRAAREAQPVFVALPLAVRAARTSSGTSSVSKPGLRAMKVIVWVARRARPRTLPLSDSSPLGMSSASTGHDWALA